MEFSKKYAELIALAILLLGLAYYLYDIDRWLAYDDEGGYLYAAWRIGKGEMPYRDFLTPKLPLFLYPGALLLKLSGNSFLALRATSALAVVLSAVFLYLTVRRVFDARTALLAMAVFMVHRDVYWSARFFRPEAYMLLYSAAGMFVFVCSYPNRRRGLAVSGLLFAMATLSRLFGFLPPAGLRARSSWTSTRFASSLMPHLGSMSWRWGCIMRQPESVCPYTIRRGSNWPRIESYWAK